MFRRACSIKPLKLSVARTVPAGSPALAYAAVGSHEPTRDDRLAKDTLDRECVEVWHDLRRVSTREQCLSGADLDAESAAFAGWFSAENRSFALTRHPRFEALPPSPFAKCQHAPNDPAKTPPSASAMEGTIGPTSDLTVKQPHKSWRGQATADSSIPPSVELR